MMTVSMTQQVKPADAIFGPPLYVTIKVAALA